MKRCFPRNRIKTLVCVAVMATLCYCGVLAEQWDGLFINEPWLRAGECGGGYRVGEGAGEEAEGSGGGRGGLVRAPGCTSEM